MLPPVSSVLSTAPLSPTLATINEMLAAVLPNDSDPSPSTPLISSTSAAVPQSVANELITVGLSDAVAESGCAGDSGGESHGGEADAPPQEKEGLLLLLFFFRCLLYRVSIVLRLFCAVGVSSSGVARKLSFKDATPTKRAKKSVELFPPPPPLRAATSVWIS